MNTMVLMRNNMKRFITLVCNIKVPKNVLDINDYFQIGFRICRKCNMIVDFQYWKLICTLERCRLESKHSTMGKMDLSQPICLARIHLLFFAFPMFWDFKLTSYVWSLKGNYIKGIRSESCCLFLTQWQSKLKLYIKKNIHVFHMVNPI